MALTRQRGTAMRCNKKRPYLLVQFAIVVALVGARAGTSLANPCSVGLTAHANPPGIIANPVVYSFYWGAPYWNAAAIQRSNLDATWSDLANKPAFWARLAEYGVGPGSFG